MKCAFYEIKKGPARFLAGPDAIKPPLSLAGQLNQQY